MREDCCSNEISFSLWIQRTYYSFWDVINTKKWMRPLYNVHYRILCWLGKADFEDSPGLYDDDCPYNPEKFIEQCRAERTDEDILRSSEFEAEVKRISIITYYVGIDYDRLTHKKFDKLGRYCIFLDGAEATDEQMKRLSRLTGYSCGYSEPEGFIVIDLDGKFDEYEKQLEEEDSEDE